MILTVKQAVGNFTVFKLLKVCWIINAVLWNFIEHSSDEVIQNNIGNMVTESVLRFTLEYKNCVLCNVRTRIKKYSKNLDTFSIV